MGTVLHLVSYISLVVFVVAVVAKVLKYASMRHEKGKADKTNELKHTLRETILLQTLWEKNRPLWWRSFPLLFGLYNMVACLCLVAAGAGLEIAGVDVMTTGGVIGAAVYFLTAFTGILGTGLCLAGSMGLLQHRMSGKMKDSTKPADIFNLLFIGAVSGLLLASIMTEPSMESFRSYAVSLMQFKLDYALPTLPSVSFLLASTLIACLPLPHMAHFAVK
jgi:nitrate reductase gamma subunit